MMRFSFIKRISLRPSICFVSVSEQSAYTPSIYYVLNLSFSFNMSTLSWSPAAIRHPPATDPGPGPGPGLGLACSGCVVVVAAEI